MASTSRGQTFPTVKEPIGDAKNGREDVGDFVFKPIEELLMDTLPQKSIGDYKKTWQKFLEEMSITSNEAPSEEDYLRYLEKMRRVKKYKGSTLWSLYSKLNAVNQRLYGKRKRHDFLRFEKISVDKLQETSFKTGLVSRNSSCRAGLENL